MLIVGEIGCRWQRFRLEAFIEPQLRMGQLYPADQSHVGWQILEVVIVEFGVLGHIDESVDLFDDLDAAPHRSASLGVEPAMEGEDHISSLELAEALMQGCRGTESR